MGKSHKVSLIDANNLAHKSWHVYKLTGPYGENTSILYGMLNQIMQIQTKLKCNRCVICWDWGRSKRRSEVYPEYKANRTRKDDYEQFLDAIAITQKACEEMGLIQLRVNGVEADDLISILSAKLCKAKNITPIIVSDDRDMFQMLTRETMIYRPGEDKNYTVSLFRKKVGMTKGQWMTTRAIAGETKDNIIGLPDVGVKTAEKVVKHFQRYEDLIKAINEKDEYFKSGEKRLLQFLEDGIKQKIQMNLWLLRTPRKFKEFDEATRNELKLVVARALTRLRNGIRIDKAKLFKVFDHFGLIKFASDDYEKFITSFGIGFA